MLAFDEMYNLMPVTQDALEEMQTNGKHKDLEPFFEVLPSAKFYPLGDLHHLGPRLRRDQEDRWQGRRRRPEAGPGDLQKKAETAAAEAKQRPLP
ncbi:hypothetical protein [Streptomyces sp. 135]|uniref:hypothetical protein n=1 Tax=Streptomyces sp. 135 TaxID=2838850 RepID=UPI001CC166BF|nr:hypothetical protein [Streptomyces sp. 135]